MDTNLIHTEGDDFGTLEVLCGRDDDASLAFDGTNALVKLPLFAFQAREIIEALTPLANTKDAD